MISGRAIQLQPEVKPYSLFMPRPIRTGPNGSSYKELSQVDIPTPWCAGMVVCLEKEVTLVQISNH